MKNNSYFHFGTILKGLIILGLVILLTFGLFYVVASTVPSESIWDDAFASRKVDLFFFVPVGMVLVILGSVFYFIHREFVKLGEFAAEVESGEFEKKLQEELNDE